MKGGIRAILGKTVTGVVITENLKQPRIQLFLAFSDGTYFEVWGESFSCAGGIDGGGIEEATRYAQSLGASIHRIYALEENLVSNQSSLF